MTFIGLVILAGFMVFINLKSTNRFNLVVSYVMMWTCLAMAFYLIVKQMFPFIP